MILTRGRVEPDRKSTNKKTGNKKTEELGKFDDSPLIRKGNPQHRIRI